MIVAGRNPLATPQRFTSFDVNLFTPSPPRSRDRHSPTFNTFRAAFLRPGHRQPSPAHKARKHNHNSVASNLPENVLIKVFLACINSADGTPGSWSWVTISYVCSSWRRAALKSQALWHYIDFSHPRATYITLARAKGIPLTINATVHPDNIPQLRRTLQLAHQIRDIHLITSRSNLKPLAELLAHPNAALQSLTICVNAENDADNAVYIPPFPTEGPSLVNLRRMEIRNAPFYLLTSRCNALRHLHISDIPLSERPSQHQFFSLLKGMHFLEHLTLYHAFPTESTFDAAEFRTTLLHLKTVNLTGSVKDLADFMECLILPGDARLICNIDDLAGLEDRIYNLAQALGVFSWQAMRPVEILVIGAREESCRFLEEDTPNPNFRQYLRLRGYGADGGTVYDITIGSEFCYTSDEDLVTSLASIWHALAFAHVHTLVLQNIDIVTQKSWSQFLRKLPSLRMLDISGYAPSGLVWALLLNARAHSQDNDDTQRILVPRLKDIYVHSVDCASGGFMLSSRSITNSYIDLDDSKFLDVFSYCLSERWKHGLRMRSFSIACCQYVATKTVEEIRASIPHLIWDSGGMDPPLVVRKMHSSPVQAPSTIGVTYHKLSSHISSASPRQHYYRLQTLQQYN